TYAKAQHKGDCTNTSTADGIESRVDAFIDDLVTEINGSMGPPTASKCSSKELVAAATKARVVVNCYAKAAATGKSSSVAACIAAAQDKVGRAWTKATSAGACKTTVDAAPIESKIDSFAADVNAQLTAATCAPTSCAAQGKVCGSIPDGCGNTLSCGT